MGHICRVFFTDGVPYPCSVFRFPKLQGIDEGQCRFPFRKIITNILAHFCAVTSVIEHIVYQLECHADMVAVAAASKSFAVLQAITRR